MFNLSDQEKNSLFKRLMSLKLKIKRRYQLYNGKTPIVCKDEALLNMSQIVPTKLEDLTHIKGISNVFIEKYGKVFIHEINEFLKCKNSNNVNELDDKTLNVLRKLSEKLTNLNKRNKLIYMSKIVKRDYADLFELGQYNLYNLFFKNNTIKIKNNPLKNTDEKIDNNLYENIRKISRNSLSQFKESGQNNLYIGFPFVIGK